MYLGTHLNRIDPLSDNGAIHVKVSFILYLLFDWTTEFWKKNKIAIIISLFKFNLDYYYTAHINYN